MTLGEVRGVLFDAVGTLIVLRETVGSVYARHAIPHGVELPAWRLDDAYVRIVRSAPPRVFPDVPPEEIAARERAWWRAVVRSTFLAADSTVKFDDFDAFFSGLFDFYADARAWRLRPGAVEALRTVRARGLRTGIVSNFDQRLPILLQHLGIQSLLDVVVLPADCAAQKPDARIYRTALARLDLPATSVVYVGDDPVKDGAGARDVGMHSLEVAGSEDLETLVSRIERLAGPLRAS